MSVSSPTPPLPHDPTSQMQAAATATTPLSASPPLPPDRSSLSSTTLTLTPQLTAVEAVSSPPSSTPPASTPPSMVWRDSPLSPNRHLPPLRPVNQSPTGAPNSALPPLPPPAIPLPLPLAHMPSHVLTTSISASVSSSSSLQLNEPPVLSADQSVISLNQLPASFAATTSYSKAHHSSSEHSDVVSATPSDRDADTSEAEDSEHGGRHTQPALDDKRASNSETRAEDDMAETAGRAGVGGKRRWVRPAPIQALPLASSPPQPTQPPAFAAFSSHLGRRSNQIIPFSPTSASSVSSISSNSSVLPPTHAAGHNLLSPSQDGPSPFRPYPSMSSSRAPSPSPRSLISPPKALRSVTLHAARSLSPSHANNNNNSNNNNNNINIASATTTATVSSSSASTTASSLSSQLQLLRLSSIGQQHHLSPVFRADGEVEVRYLIETQRARRRYIARVLAFFVLAFVCVEALYVLMDGYDFMGVGWMSLSVRLGYAACVLCYCGLLRYWLRFMVSPAAMDRSLLLLMSCAAVALLASAIIYISDSSATATSVALSLQTLCVTLVLTAGFTYNILELPFTFSLTHSAIAIFFFNLSLARQLRSQLFDVDQLIYANLWLVTMLAGLLLGRRQQEMSRHIDFDKKRQQFLDRKKSVKLLQSMLPPQIIHNYLQGSVGQISAVATIGFCTIKLGPVRVRHDRSSTLGVNAGGQYTGAEPGTPSLIGGHSPAELMQRLHDTFKRIDGIVNLYAIRGVSKIETVSQQYLLCSGLLDTVDDHAAAMIEVCLEILHLTSTSSKADKGKGRSVPLSLQIGISTGSVVGGIIGTHRNFFKVFGDTVNVAARMCSKSEGGCILMSESTYQAMTDRQRCTFRISERRDITVKGKGTMGTRQVARKEEWVAKFGKAHRQTGGSTSGDVKTAVLNQRTHYHKLVQSTSLHPLTLRYRWDTLTAVAGGLVERNEREELEERFQCEWAPAKADLARRTTFVLAAFSVSVLVWSCTINSWSQQARSVQAASILTGVLAASRLVLGCTNFLVRHLTPLVIVWTAFGVGINILLMASSAFPTWFLPSLGMCLHVISPTILYQLHFGYALPLALLSLLSYVVVVVAANVEASVASVLVLLVVLSMCLSFFILSSFERDLRFNFLLHFAMELEQRQMDKFLDNLLPKFVVDLLSKRAVNDRGEREASRLSGAGAGLHGRQSSMVDSPLPPHSPGIMSSPAMTAGQLVPGNLASSLSSGSLLPIQPASPLLATFHSPSLLPNQPLAMGLGTPGQHIRSVSLSASAANQANSLNSPAPSYSSRFAMELRNATVFESDIVGYTAMASTWTASHTLHVLNTLFSKFDEAAAACNVEKIETIGDAFLVMAADGPPDPVLDFALRIVEELRECNEKLATGPTQQLEIRVGVCSGVCFGGVIGDAVPRFHLFGDAHDAAIAIEQSGKAGEVLVSESTWTQSGARYVYEAMEGMVVAGVSGGVYALKGKANNNVIMHDAVTQRRHSALQYR